MRTKRGSKRVIKSVLFLSLASVVCIFFVNLAEAAEIQHYTIPPLAKGTAPIEVEIKVKTDWLDAQGEPWTGPEAGDRHKCFEVKSKGQDISGKTAKHTKVDTELATSFDKVIVPDDFPPNPDPPPGPAPAPNVWLMPQLVSANYMQPEILAVSATALSNMRWWGGDPFSANIDPLIDRIYFESEVDGNYERIWETPLGWTRPSDFDQKKNETIQYLKENGYDYLPQSTLGTIAEDAVDWSQIYFSEDHPLLEEERSLGVMPARYYRLPDGTQIIFNFRTDYSAAGQLYIPTSTDHVEDVAQGANLDKYAGVTSLDAGDMKNSPQQTTPQETLPATREEEQTAMIMQALQAAANYQPRQSVQETFSEKSSSGTTYYSPSSSSSASSNPSATTPVVNSLAIGLSSLFQNGTIQKSSSGTYYSPSSSSSFTSYGNATSSGSTGTRTNLYDRTNPYRFW